jgi:1-acyl-sn-glycerol-3-phosphate acyltransferase
MMSGALKHPWRAGGRLIWLTGELMWTAICFVPRVLFRRGSSDLKARAVWLQVGCQRVLRVLNVQIQASGSIPSQGLLVSNHLGYLDVLVLGALIPSVFVAKSEVKNWPMFGWLARLGGTLFADRARRIQVGSLTTEIEGALRHEILLVLFPEGTSSDGRTVLPFKSSLLEPATKGSFPVAASLIEYHLEDGDVGEEVCYWRDMTFFPHLLNLLSKRGIVASVHFSEIREERGSRKELARRLHSEVLGLKLVPRIPLCRSELSI